MSNEIALLTDTHAGVRGGSLPFLEQFRSFHLDLFWPTIKERGIKEVYFLGDMFDQRKQVSVLTMSVFYEAFVRPVEELDVTVHVILGNHDMYYRERPDPNSPSELLRDNSQFVIYDRPKEILGTPFLAIPYPTKATEEETVKLLAKSKHSICLAHVDIKGFQLSGGVLSDHGFDPSAFKRFKAVYSGHYHKQQELGNIRYLGAPYQMNWGDYGNSNGFHILNDKHKLTFLRNPWTMYEKVYIGQKEKVNVTGKYVRVIPGETSTPKIISEYVANLNAQNPIEIKVIEANQDVSSKQVDVHKIEIEDTKVLIHQYVDQLDNVTVDKNILNSILDNLYDESRNE